MSKVTWNIFYFFKLVLIYTIFFLFILVFVLIHHCQVITNSYVVCTVQQISDLKA